MSLYSVARDLYDMGIMTIPIKPHSKQAAIAWREYQTRPPILAELKRWFIGNNQLNIAVLVGNVSGNLVILDFDDPSTYWEYSINTYTVISSRGYHVYLRVDRMPDKTEHRQGLDVKSTGYVLCPPSIHPSGTQYRALNNTEIAEISSLEEVGIAVAPNIEGVHAQPVVINVSGGVANINVNSGTHTHIRCNNPLSYLKHNYPITSLFDETFQTRDDNKVMTHCPGQRHFNGDRNPSLVLDTTSNRFYCHRPDCEFNGNGRGGSVVDAYMLIFGKTLSQAIAAMCEELGI